VPKGGKFVNLNNCGGGGSIKLAKDCEGSVVPETLSNMAHDRSVFRGLLGVWEA
jgi:hypothetical protein